MSYRKDEICAVGTANAAMLKSALGAKVCSVKDDDGSLAPVAVDFRAALDGEGKHESEQWETDIDRKTDVEKDDFEKDNIEKGEFHRENDIEREDSDSKIYAHYGYDDELMESHLDRNDDSDQDVMFEDKWGERRHLWWGPSDPFKPKDIYRISYRMGESYERRSDRIDTAGDYFSFVHEQDMMDMQIQEQEEMEALEKEYKEEEQKAEQRRQEARRVRENQIAEDRYRQEKTEEEIQIFKQQIEKTNGNRISLQEFTKCFTKD